MSEVVDMCKCIRNRNLHFVLNPDNCWESFDSKFAPAVSNDWYEIKFLNESGTAINAAISTVPSDKGGIYLFFLRPDIVPNVHKYILYVGRVRSTPTQNLRKRFREYVDDSRSDITYMRETWGKELYIRYLPLTENEIITSLEKELIRTIIPPCNTDYPGVLNKAMKAAFI